jgi:hypothetical protein
MTAVARDLYFSSRVFATLAAVAFVSAHGATACWMRALFLLNTSH